MARKRPPRRRAPARRPRPSLGAAEAELVARLGQKTGLTAREVIERALSAYAAAVAPGMPTAPAAVKKTARRPPGRLFVSIDGRPEIPIERAEFVLGRDPGCDAALDVPLISPR